MTLKKVKKGVSIHAFFGCNSVKLNLVAKKVKKDEAQKYCVLGR